MSSIRLTDASPFWVSRQATWYGSTAETSKPSNPRRSWITNTLDHFQLLKWFPHMLPNSVYCSRYNAYIQFSTSPSSNPPVTVQSQTAEKTLHPLLNWMTQTNMKFRGFWIAKSTPAERAWVLSTWWSGRVLITPQNQRVGNPRKTCGMPLILSGNSTDHIPISQSLPDLPFIFFTQPVKELFPVGSCSEKNYKNYKKL